MIRFPILLSALTILAFVSPSQGQPGVVVISDADIASNSTLGVEYIRDARIAADGNIWIAARFTDQEVGWPFTVTGIRWWAGQLMSDGSVLNPNLGTLDQFHSLSAQSFALSRSRRQIAYSLNGNLWRTEIDGQHTLLLTNQSDALGPIGNNPLPIGQFAGIGSGAGIANTGDVAFSGKVRLTGEEALGSKRGIWRTHNNTPYLIALEGNPTPGIPGAVFDRTIGRSKSIVQYVVASNTPIPFASNTSGTIAFTSGIRIPGFDFVYESGVWVDRGAGLELVARTSAPVPGEEYLVFSPDGFSTPVVNDHGQVAFMADTSRSRSFSWDGIWRETANGLQVVAQRNDEVAEIYVGADGDAQLDRFYDFQFNNNESVAFHAEVDIHVVELEPFSSTRREEQGIWIADSDGEMERIAMTASPPPLGTSGTWDQSYFLAQMNDADQVVFIAHELVRTAEELSYVVLRATQRTGEVVEILRTGDLIDFGDAASPELLPIRSFEFLDFDDAGRALVSVRAADGSIALVLSDAVAAPSIYGDYNGDGQTNLADYNAWQSTFGTEVRIGDGADGNLDGRIDAADYTVWRDAFEAGVFVTVPEPGTVVLLLVVVLVLPLHRRNWEQ